MHKALYRVYRPSRFSDIVGQDTIIQILKHQIAEGNVSHAYLFSGSRGTGKTSTAKVFSKAVNCQRPVDAEPCESCISCKEGEVDIIEIDAASNNSVDNVRDIRDNVIYAPAYGRYKIYIIDEVHMLSQGAFNALLKTLEEPPPHVIFILATTEPHKIPQTVLSRVQRYDFKKIDASEAEKRLKSILEDMGRSYEEEALRFIVQKSEGSLRDALSLLDKALSAGELTYSLVVGAIGGADERQLALLLRYMKEKNAAALIRLLEEIHLSGKDIKRLVSELVDYVRDVLMVILGAAELTGRESGSREALEESGKLMSIEDCTMLMDELSALESSIKYASAPKVLVEAFLLKKIYGVSPTSGEDGLSSDFQEHLAALEQKIRQLEEKIRRLEKNKPEIESKRMPGEKEEDKKNTAEYFEDIRAKAVLSDQEQGIVDELNRKMESVYSELQKNKHANIKALLQNGEVVRYVNDHAYIAYEDHSSMLRNMIDTQENKEIINRILEELFGKEIKVVFIEKKETARIAEDEKEALVEKQVREVFPDVPFAVYENEEEYLQAMKEERK